MSLWSEGALSDGVRPEGALPSASETATASEFPVRIRMKSKKEGELGSLQFMEENAKFSRVSRRKNSSVGFPNTVTC